MVAANSNEAQRRYLPAAGRDLFLPLYDPIVRLLGFARLANALLEQASLQPHHRVLDVGCGTGTFALLLKQHDTSIDVTGIDPDPKALARATRKANRAGLELRLDRGFADALPYETATFDRVFSSMMFHHLPKHDRRKALVEWRRVLRSDGQLHLLDFASGTHSFLAQLVHGHHALSEPADDRLIQRVRDAGFAEARRVGDRDTIFGRVAFYQALAAAQ
jgi:ubiquinone/menaquinone biosynthesis C-methylase UbiE